MKRNSKALSNDKFIREQQCKRKKYTASTVKKRAAMLFAVLLMCLMLLSMLAPTMRASAASGFYTKSFTYTVINATRYTDYLVIFTPAYGSKTGTNAYGYEVTVKDGRIVKAGGNDSDIPSNGFVVSGHGSQIDMLKQYALLGSACSYNSYNKTVSFSFDATAMFYGTELLINEINNDYSAALSEYKNAEYGLARELISESETLFAKAKADYNNGSITVSGYATRHDAINSKIQSAKQYLTESLPVETRGVWIRPTQKTMAQVSAMVKSVVDAGLNTISLETMYSGCMIMPMPSDSYYEHNPVFGGFDVLQAYIDECHKYNVELHLWLPIFYVGNSDNYYGKFSVWSKREDWRMIANTGSANDMYTDGNSYYYFLNPANPEAKSFLLETYRYILENYDIDVFELDYARYPMRTGSSGSNGIDFGYDSLTISEFKAAYPKYRNYNITYNSSAAYWSDWCKFRATYITDFIVSIKNLIKSIRPDVALSADTACDVAYGQNYIMQDIPAWLQSDCLDMVHLMAYGASESMVSQSVETVRSYLPANSDCYIVPGLGIFMDEVDKYMMLDQCMIAREYDADGVLYFQVAQYLSKGCSSYLRSGPYRINAVSPTYSGKQSVLATLSYMCERIDLIIIPNASLSSADADKLETIKDRIYQANAKINNTGLSSATDTITDIKKLVEQINNINVKNVLLEDINGAIKYKAASLTTVEDNKGNGLSEDVSDEPTAPIQRGTVADVLLTAQDSTTNSRTPDGILVISALAVAGIIIAILRIKKNRSTH